MTTDATWRTVIADEQSRLPMTRNQLADGWAVENSPGLFETSLIERAAGLAYRVKLTSGFGDETMTMAARQAVAFESFGMLADPAQRERIAAVLAFVTDEATRDLSGAVVADKVRALLEETGATR